MTLHDNHIRNNELHSIIKYSVSLETNRSLAKTLHSGIVMLKDAGVILSFKYMENKVILDQQSLHWKKS